MRHIRLSIISFLVLYIYTGYAQQQFAWINPISSGIDKGGLRDCFIFRAEGYWYLTGTSSPHWGDGYDNPGVRLYRSSDMINWKQTGIIIPNPGTSKWYASRFWAPEITYINGKYYCTFNCRNERDGFDVKQSWGIAVAEHAEGPYKVLSDDSPVSRGNDATLFEDEDGQVWAAWCGASSEHPDGNVMTLARISLETLELTDIHEIFGGGTGPISTTGWDKCGVEGPAIFKRGDTYYMMYSSWQRGYEVGVATTKDLNGTWCKSPENPLFGSQSRSKWADADENDWRDLGHNTVFTGPDGELWMSCHGQLRNSDRPPMLVIQPLAFDDEGKLHSMDIPHKYQKVAWNETLSIEHSIQESHTNPTYNLQGKIMEEGCIRGVSITNNKKYINK